jgi:hypothetical protein
VVRTRSRRRAADAGSIEIEVAQLRDLDLKALRLRAGRL